MAVCQRAGVRCEQRNRGVPWGKLRSVDKERVLSQIDQRRTNFAEVAYLDLELATKIVKEIEISSCLICPQLRRVHCLLARCAGVAVCQRAEVRCD